jgi:hypothetical protein
MQNTDEIKAFIAENADLFWYIPESEKQNISPEVLVEFILNYGDMTKIKKLFRLLGLKTVAAIFFSMKDRKIGNFYPEIHNFFSLYFKQYAQ